MNQLESVMQSSAVMPLLKWGGSVGFSLLLIFFFWRVYRAHHVKIKFSVPGITILPWLMLCILGLYQARWQMFGFMDAEFLRVQRGFDPRGDLIGNRFYRGKIFDANGELLASDHQKDSHLIRVYTTGAASVHVLGYHHPIFGATGLERALDKTLMGRSIHSMSDLFRLLGNGFVHRKLRGNPVQLTIYKALQETAAGILKDRKGAITAVDPRNGAVLLMASSPGFNPANLSSSYFDQLRNQTDSPFLNRATHGLYPPGSTFKVLVALQALLKDIDKSYFCGPEGFVSAADEPVLHDYEHYVMEEKGQTFHGHGQLSLDPALDKSCNVFFSKLSQDLGPEALLEMAQTAGLHREILPVKPGLKSKSGNLPDIRSFTGARTARFAIGQDDLLVTPLHLALIAGALGHEGTIYHPRYVKNTEPEPWLQLAEPRYATEIARKMIHIVEFGTGRRARIPQIIVGGKTGTAENTTGKSHALFIGFAPWPVPTMAISVIIEQSGTGGSVAAPAAAEIFAKADKLGILLMNPDGKK